MMVPEWLSLSEATASKAECVQALWRQSSRYHLASLQDRDPLIAARHNGYAVALIDAVRDLATEDEVKQITGGSLLKFRQEIIGMQDKLEGKLFEIAKKISTVATS